MSLSNLVVKITYQGDGSNKTFAIPFSNIVNDSDETKVYLRDESGTSPVETLQEEGSLNDYLLDGAVLPGDFDTNVVFNEAPTVDQKVVIYRELPLTQTLDFPQDGYNAKSLMKALDRIVAMIQQVNNQFTRVPMLPVTEQSEQLVMPEPVSLQFLRYNEAGTNLELVDIADAVGDLIKDLGGLPAGGETGAALVKKSDSDGDTEWKQFSYEGFSSKHNEEVDLATLEETLDYLIGISYVPPTVSLAADGSGTLREKGDTVTASELVASITKKSDPIAQVRFYLGSTLLSTVLNPNPEGGTESYTWFGSFDDNSTFKVEVDDDGSTGGPTTVQATRSFSFVYPYYVGAGEASLDASGIAALTKRIITSTASRAETITVSAGEYTYFAYPKSYGALTSIIDENGFEVKDAWTQRELSITGLDENAVTYYVYEGNNALAAGSYGFTFKR